MPNANLRILVPEGTTNYILNPSIRNDTTGWVAKGSTITRTLDQARFGISSLKVVTNGIALNEGTYFRVSSLSGVQDFVTVSAYVRGAGRVRIRLEEQLGGQWSSASVSLTSTRWKRLEVTGRCTGRNDVRLYVESDESTPKAITFYMDGAMMELKPYATTYVDGYQPGCRWNIVANSTTSTRDPYTRQGGRWVALAGPCRDDDDIYVTAVGGMGMETISNNTQSFSQAPGSYFQNTKIKDRVITFTFNAKNENTQTNGNPSLRKLHELRQQLIDLFKPDVGFGDEEFIIEYSDGPYPIYIAVRYEAGLEGSWDIRNQWINTFPIRFLACSPMFWEDDQEVANLNFMTNLGAQASPIARVDGTWRFLNYGQNLAVSSFAIGKNGELYMGGNFTVVNNNANAINPLIPALRIAVWDGTSWSAVGLGADDVIEAIAVSPDGKLYVTGSFLNIGGIAANRVAYWDPVTSTWNAMGSGLNGGGLAIGVAPNGNVYVGGSFTTAGGGTAKYVARWDGGSWHPMGASLGVNDSVRTLAITKDGSTVYIGGSFNAEFGGAGGTLNHVASYAVSSNTFSTMGSGFSGGTSIVSSLVVSPLSGTLYAAGSFTLSGTTVLNYIGKWNGSMWVAMGTGFDASVGDIGIDQNENVFAAGAFSIAGGVACFRLALWNGTAWTNVDMRPNSGGSPIFSAVLFHPNGDLYIGGSSFVATASLSSSINLITNVGSAEVSPLVYIKGPGSLRWLENETIGKRLYMDLSILNNEEVTIDFPRATIYSSVRGDLSYAIIPGSDFRSWKLAPGENKVAMFMTNDVNAVAQISYTPTHHSADATARGEEMT